jgi:hypothetical protein
MKTKPLFLSLSLAALGCLAFVQSESTKHSCNNALANKIVSFEYNYYPGNQLVPGLRSKHGYTMKIPSTGTNTLTFTNAAAWRTEKCGNSLCIVSLKKKWEQHYLYMKTWGGTSSRWNPSLGYFEDIHAVDPAWTVQFDIECEDCAKREHCYVSHRFYGNKEKKNYGRLFTQANGLSQFGYQFDQSDEDWFDWSVHVHRQVPAGAPGQGGHYLAIISIVTVLSIL